jgi:hypothetical protein
MFMHFYMPPDMPPEQMREIDVRRALYKSEIRRIVESDPTSLVVDELGVMEGKYRVDVAVINGRLHGYEIKSFRQSRTPYGAAS